MRKRHDICSQTRFLKKKKLQAFCWSLDMLTWLCPRAVFQKYIPWAGDSVTVSVDTWQSLSAVLLYYLPGAENWIDSQHISNEIHPIGTRPNVVLAALQLVSSGQRQETPPSNSLHRPWALISTETGVGMRDGWNAMWWWARVGLLRALKNSGAFYTVFR